MMKFSEDIIPITDLKVNPGKIVNQIQATHRPVLLTSRGRGVVVMQDLDEYEKKEEEMAFIKAINKGLLDIREGREKTLDEARLSLGID